ncbi:hypothetical protein ASC90_25225 [Rhizobium sp. Root1220]|nr:hypothetical protein ASC90_25225 [Rhizobium sp. Root1220]
MPANSAIVSAETKVLASCNCSKETDVVLWHDEEVIDLCVSSRAYLRRIEACTTAKRFNVQSGIHEPLPKD